MPKKTFIYYYDTSISNAAYTSTETVKPLTKALSKQFKGVAMAEDTFGNPIICTGVTVVPVPSTHTHIAEI